MASNTPEGQTPPSPGPEEALDRLLHELGERVKEMAVEFARQEGGKLSADHVKAAYRRHVKITQEPAQPGATHHRPSFPRQPLP